jgi:hypothetical protein
MQFSSLKEVCCVSDPHSFDLDPDQCSGSVRIRKFLGILDPDP